MPVNGQAETAERTFASLSRVLDDRPEFKGAHAGHKPGAAPDSSVVPASIETAQAVCAREVARHNSEPGRRGQGMRGRSCQAEAGLAKRVRRTPAQRQLCLSGRVYTLVKVNRWVVRTGRRGCSHPDAGRANACPGWGGGGTILWQAEDAQAGQCRA